MPKRTPEEWRQFAQDLHADPKLSGYDFDWDDRGNKFKCIFGTTGLSQFAEAVRNEALDEALDEIGNLGINGSTDQQYARGCLHCCFAVLKLRGPNAGEDVTTFLDKLRG